MRVALARDKQDPDQLYQSRGHRALDGNAQIWTLIFESRTHFPAEEYESTVFPCQSRTYV